MSGKFDIAIVGAGMAGASLAAELAPFGSVVMIEAERAPGYHATGRSAAFWEECYGGPAIVPLTLASGQFLRDHGLLRPRGALYLGRAEDEGEIDRFLSRFRSAGAHIDKLGRSAIEARVPELRPEWTLAVDEPACSDIDVAALHQHYLAAASHSGASLKVSASMERAEREGDGWRLLLANGEELRAGILVNSAGAWADNVAKVADARPLGITPFRRTVVQLRTNPVPPDDLPLVLDIGGQFYFKPESGRVWLSPHDETPSPPMDVAPEELDVAIAIDRFENVVDWEVQAVERKWAGLRSFTPDRLPVYGFDGQRQGFFWFAGQGGFGIQTAPAAARLAAQVMLGRSRDEMTESLDESLYSPLRFG